ncbi:MULTISPECIES: hypothetical protein [unclassified Paenibacillus]|uniref:hypothetical protein n=1 Tax=unclassified Paenibacillus TaxID=185978 RepID=UPI00277FE711|nr:MULTISPECIES: hypothetical protein [unclassified Paenibacillus]MDQ0896234.1 hypothetical protein [Paenibacillus sp. V4I7]MDQ0913951.1 hypothetical protein [Paenibacillus sp. V4I5]
MTQQIIDLTSLLKKRISEETVEEIRSLDLREFAIAMGDEIRRVGKWYMTYRNGGERTPSVGINPTQRNWQDFTRQGVGGNDVLSYYAYRLYDETSLKDRERFVEACIQVCGIAGIPLKFQDGTFLEPDGERRVSHSQIVERDDQEDAKREDNWLDFYYRRMLDLLDLGDMHRDHLKQERGFTPKEIQIRGYRSVTDNYRSRYMLTKELINSLKEDPVGVPGFVLMQKDHMRYWTLVARNGFLIPFRNLWNQICGFQLRVDDPRMIKLPPGYTARLNNGEVDIIDKESESVVWKGVRDDFPVSLERGTAVLEPGAKYVWLSTSKDVQRGVMQGARIGHPTPAPYHVAVPSAVLEIWKSGDLVSNVCDVTEVWWGEGPLKGDISADLTDAIHLQAAGVRNYRQLFEPTLQINPKRVIIAFDSDAQEKVADVGKTVEQCVEEAKELFLPKGIELYYASWHPVQKNGIAKGIDDLLRMELRPIMYALGGEEYPYEYPYDEKTR